LLFPTFDTGDVNPVMVAVKLLAVLLLIVATAFFVATEFALVKIRPSRVDQMAMEGRRGAVAVQKVIANLDGYLSACQLGITVTALGLGWLGEDTFAQLLHLLFAPLAVPEGVSAVLSVAVSFFIVTFLHVVAGELAPKTLAIQKAEQVSLAMAPIMTVFYKVMYPLIWLLNGAANKLVGLFGLKVVHEHGETPTEEELRIILSESYKGGMINKNEFSLVNRVFKFDELLAREIMVPRTDMVCLSVTKSLEENMNIVKNERYTRYPVIRESKDNIIGMVNTKEFFLRAMEGRGKFRFEELIHPILTVPETIPVSELMRRMQFSRSHIAILVDEYGGTSGMITMEDIVEEIVGEIRDEFDAEETPQIIKVADGHLIVDGLVTLDTVEELLDVRLPDDEHDTIGGWLYGMHSELKKGETWDYGPLTFNVLERSNHRIRKVEIVKKAGAGPASQGQSGGPA